MKIRVGMAVGARYGYQMNRGIASSISGCIGMSVYRCRLLGSEVSARAGGPLAGAVVLTGVGSVVRVSKHIVLDVEPLSIVWVGLSREGTGMGMGLIGILV
jgi:hypothetical protein